MDHNDLKFFREGTKAVCSSLDLNITLENCFNFVKKFMPINGIAVNIYDPEKKSVKNIACYSNEKEHILKDFTEVRLDKEGVTAIEKIPVSVMPAQILNSPEEQNVAKVIWKSLGFPEMSILLLHPVIEKIKLGVVFIYAEGFNRYTKESGRLFFMLHDPFSIAVSNTLKHRETIALKEKLKDDNSFLKNDSLV